MIPTMADPNPRLRAYFGDDAALDPKDFARQAAGKAQPVYQLKGHRHMSEIFAINTPDDAFAKLLLGFAVAMTGQNLIRLGAR
ncbi:MAG: hypothetical protein EBT05_12075 [Betaproteobacteria bacterium]|nr:hypothetical protein [Betaproteobacteria bacterium]